MKTMTCKQMGGPCDTAFTANTAEEMMKVGGEHLEEQKADPAHKAAYDMMVAAQTDANTRGQWIAKFQEDFAALPND